MDKKTFLEELKAGLLVLQEDELSDILDEYEQHIDMKVHNGLTEEEAIADFGNRKELMAEILEAYHVRADYGTGGALPKEEEEKRPFRLWERFRASCSQCSKTVTGKLKRLRTWLMEQIRPDSALEDSGKSARTFFQSRGEDRPFSANPLVRFCQKAAKRCGCLLKTAWRLLRRLFQAAWRFFCLCLVQGYRLLLWAWLHGRRIFWWCAGMIWNGGWILFALVCAGAGLFTLFGLGLLTVLLAQGYPLAGVTIGAIGLNISLFAAAGLGLSLLRTSRKKHSVGIEARALEDGARREEDECHA